jgi:hypothetical protein
MTELADDLYVGPNEPDAGTTVLAAFDDVGATRSRLRSTAALERAAMLHEYFRVLQATHALQQDTDAVLAQAAHAVAHAQQCRSRRRVRSRASGAGARG